MNDLFPYPTHIDSLDNGLDVILVEMPGSGLAAFWTIVRTGSRDEHQKGRTGFAHFFEHMMFRGTPRYPAERYQRILTEIGADANAYTTDDLTAYHVDCAAEDLDTVIELESDRFRHLAYTPEDFATEAGAVYGEYRMSRSDPSFALYEALLATAFTVHPYGHTTMGHEADIAVMPGLYDYSREFFAKHYRPDNATLLVVGDIAPAGVRQSIERHYADWRPGYAPDAIPAEPPQHGERRIDVAYDGRSLPAVCLAYKIDAFDPAHRTRVAADLLAELAFGETSEAYRRLVLDEQLIEDLDAGAAQSRDPGLFELLFWVKDTARIDDAFAQVERAIGAAATTAPPPARLADLKSRLRYEFLMGLETPAHVAEALSRFVALARTQGVDALETLYRTYDALTPDDVVAAAQSYLSPARRTVAVLRGRG